MEKNAFKSLTMSKQVLFCKINVKVSSMKVHTENVFPSIQNHETRKYTQEQASKQGVQRVQVIYSCKKYAKIRN